VLYCWLDSRLRGNDVVIFISGIWIHLRGNDVVIFISGIWIHLRRNDVVIFISGIWIHLRVYDGENLSVGADDVRERY